MTKSVTAAVVAAFGEMIGSAMRPSPDLRPAPSLPTGVGAGGGAVAEVAPGLLRRTVAFAIFGLVLNGPVFHWWYGALEKAAARCEKRFHTSPHVRAHARRTVRSKNGPSIGRGITLEYRITFLPRGIIGVGKGA